MKLIMQKPKKVEVIYKGGFMKRFIFIYFIISVTGCFSDSKKALLMQ